MARRRPGPRVPYTIQLQALVRALDGKRAEALALADALDLAPFDGHIIFHFVEVLACCGETDRAIAALELSVGKGFTPAEFIRVHCPFIEPLRAHARFEGIVERAGASSDAVRRGIGEATA